VQNLTLCFCSATPVSYKGDKILCLSRLVFKIWCRTDRWQADNRCSNWNI